MEFILIFIIIFFLLPRIILRLTSWYLQRKARSTFRDFASQFGNAEYHEPPTPKSPKKQKIYTSDEGEYIEYEEINTTSTTVTQQDGETVVDTTSTVEQIVDAEW